MALAVAAATLLPLVGAPTARAFSIMAHQGTVDATWQQAIVPAIRSRFPDVDDATLARARGFAHGGSHIADLGYFPFGNRLFSDLVHYVRTGDFVRTLVDDARTPEELAFAYGALAHFVGDAVGHPEATNPAVAAIYPKLRERYGDWVTFTEDPGAHRETEFRFDVLQVTHSPQTQKGLRQAVAFEVSRPALDRAFRATYGLGLDDVFTSTETAITTYRWAFRNALQEATALAWRLYPDDIRAADPSATEDEFVLRMSRGEFVQAFGDGFEEAGTLTKSFALLTRLVPDIGPLARLPFKPLPPEVQREFGDAFAHVVLFVRADVAERRPPLRNLNLDTGAPSRGGEYDLADATYATLLATLDGRSFADVTPDLRSDLERHFAEENALPRPDRDDAEVREEREALERLAAR